MLLTITEIGRQIETEALTSGYFPPVEAIVIGDGVPHADPETATALAHQVLSVPISVVERVSAQAVRFHATIHQGQTLTIREFGLILEDGTLYGYLPYETVVGAPLHKDTHFAFSFSLAVSREPLLPIEVKYNPLDTGEIAADIRQKIQADVDGWLTDVSGVATDGMSRIASQSLDGLSSIAAEGTAQVLTVRSEGAAQVEAIVHEGVTHVSAILNASAEEQTALLEFGAVRFYTYETRGDLRSIERGRAVVDGLGLFVWVPDSNEPDDDESCLATDNGRWLLEAVHWDVVDAWQLPDDEARDDRDEDTEGRLDNAEGRLDSAEGRWPGRVLFGTAWQSITSLAAVTQTSFVATITGATTGDHVIVTPPTALGERISVFARVTAANTVTIYINNPSAAAQSLDTGTWRVAVIQES